jgi:serine/threonine-protein kinase
MAILLDSQTETVLTATGTLGDFASPRQGRRGRTAVGSSIVCPTRFGGYELLAEIGRGAMGIVYKAHQVGGDRFVAIKTILATSLDSKDALQRFRGEAEVAGELDHPGIVPIEDVGEHDGRPFICMSLVDGEDLAARIERGSLQPEEAARIVADVAEAVQHAHDRGIVHRDLKPANILLDRFGCPKIADFGLSCKIGGGRAIHDSDSIVGTPSYMSPEQASGRGDLVGPASDIYSLGAVLYHALTRRAPFVGANPAVIIGQLLEKTPVAVRTVDPSIPQIFEVICLRCMQRTPAARYGSAGELAHDVRRVLGGV